ncbi:MAG TPA: right-handed parallel beta-helix repeat-containing protein [Verrucomicrobiae bacterium]
MTPFYPRLNSLALAVCLSGAVPAFGSQFYDDWAAAHFSDIPAQAGLTNDPDGDGEPNLVEFAFGTDPRAAGGISGAINPVFGSANGTNGIFSVEILERAGRQPGVQIDLMISAKLTGTNFFHPWWLRVTTNSQPSDPVGSVRENFTTRLPGTNVWFTRASVQLVEAGAEAAKYFVATNGSDSNNGTSTNTPFATLGKAAGLASAGNLIYLRGGIYKSSSKISLSRNGSPAQPIRIRPYPGENVAFDFSGEATGTDGISISGDCWWIYGLETTNAGHNGINISGASNIVERCVVHGSRNTGIHITGDTNTSYNLILNCDSYRNYDAPTHGQNADGFSAKWIFGPGNVFSGCRSWENADDGWDLWMGTNTVVITNCWAFRQGTNIFGDTAWEGNGNGFKLGGNYVGTPHKLVRCLAFGNAANGVDQNNNIAGQTIDNNTAWANVGVNFALKHGTNITPHIIRNNISFAAKGSDSFTSGSLLTNNSWQVVSPGVTSNDFLSVDYSLATGPRRDDGGLPELPFLRPVPTGRLVNKGVATGGAFTGSAPDLGAYETPEW